MVHVLRIGEEAVKFGKILNIYVKENEVYFLIKPLNYVYFNEHLYAYCVTESIRSIVNKLKDLPNIHPCFCTKKRIDGTDFLFVVPRYAL